MGAPWPFCPRCGYDHPNCKCYDEIPNVPTPMSMTSAVAAGGGGGGGGATEAAGEGGHGVEAALHMEDAELSRLQKLASSKNNYFPQGFAEGGEVESSPMVQPITLEHVVNSIPQMEGSYSQAAQALSQPIHEGLLGDSQINGEHVLAHVGLRNILSGELSDKIVRASERAQDPSFAGVAGLGHVEKIVGKHQDALDNESKFTFDGKPSKTEEPEPRSIEDHKELVDQMNSLAGNATGLIDNIDQSTAALKAVAPQTASSTQQAIARAVQFLSSKAAQPAMGPLDEPNEPSPSEVAQFSRYVDVVENPKIALKQIKDGTIGPETVEALQTVYPKLYDKMRHDVIASLKPSTPYSVKMAASQFLQDPMDSTLTPQRVASLQRSFYINTDVPQAPQKTPKASKSGMGELDIAGRTSLTKQDEE